MNPEERILAALRRSERYESIPLSVSRIEVLRKNETTGLTEAEMDYWAERINDICDDLENQL